MSERGDKGLTLGECNLVVSKSSCFVRAMGVIDDFQARLGSARVLLDGEENNKIKAVQTDLHQIMGSLYQRSKWEKGDESIKEVEEDIKSYQGRIENLEKFLIPGKNETEVRVDLCRTGCRLVEKELVFLKKKNKKKKLYFDLNIIKYFNKLSTYFYLMWREKLDN